MDVTHWMFLVNFDHQLPMLIADREHIGCFTYGKQLEQTNHSTANGNNECNQFRQHAQYGTEQKKTVPVTEHFSSFKYRQN